MPKVKSSQRQSQVDADSDDESPMTQASQTQSLSQAERNASSIAPGLIDSKVNEIVQFMLIMEQKKMPIKRIDINKHVLKDSYKSIYAVAMERAKTKLKQVYGMEMAEVQHGKQKAYILLNNLDMTGTEDYIDSSPDEPKMGLLMVVLSIIFMSGSVITEFSLWHSLKKLGIYKDKSHEVFGDVKKLLTQEFTRQTYLDYNRVLNSDPPSYQFQWGSRAHKEISKRSVLEFVTKMYGKEMQVDSWKSQYKEVLRSEGKLTPGVAKNGI